VRYEMLCITRYGVTIGCESAAMQGNNDPPALSGGAGKLKTTATKALIREEEL